MKTFLAIWTLIALAAPPMAKEQLQSALEELGKMPQPAQARGPARLYPLIADQIGYTKLIEFGAGPIFRAGPHTAKSLKLDADRDYGRYSLQFLSWLDQNLVPPPGDRFYRKTQQAYDRHLKTAAETYLTVRRKMLANANWHQEQIAGYRSYLKKGANTHPRHQYYDFLPGDGNMISPAVAYWLRRDLDGSATAVENLLVKFMQGYDPAFVSDLDQQSLADTRYTPDKDRIALGLPGSTWPESIQFQTGDKALGLWVEGGKAQLIEHEVKIGELVNDLHRDIEIKQPPVGPKLERSLRALVMGPPFKAGSVSEVTAKEWRECLPQTPPKEKTERIEKSCAFLFGSEGYELSFTGNGNQVEHEGATSWWFTDVTLSHGGKTQTLGNFASVIWAGDLDRDGKLDFILDRVNHYNLSAAMELLLSKSAGAKEIVRKVAEFRNGGA